MNFSKKSTYIPNNGNLRIPSRQEFHKRFSGVIYQSDFNAPIPLTVMAGRIASNIKFDENCKTYSKLEKNNKQKTIQ